MIAFEIAYILYEKESILKYALKKVINETDIGEQIMIKTVKYIFNKINI